MDCRRAKIGVVIPSVNTVVESWFPRVAPVGVSIHVSRMPIAADASLAAIGDMVKHELTAAKVLADCEPDVIMYGCTASSLARGRSFDIELMRRLSGETGIRCCTTTEAIRLAFECLEIHSVCIASPYTTQLHEMERIFFEACGLEVTGVASLGVRDTRALAEQTPDVIHRLGREAWNAGSDGLLISCLALRSHLVAAALEAELGVPVVTATQATLWAALRLTGITDSVTGYGRLLAAATVPMPASTLVG